MGESAALGSLPLCVLVDPPIPVDQEVLPFTRGFYVVDLDAVLTEEDQRLWLDGSSRRSLLKRDNRRWELEQYGMTMHERLNVGICAGLGPVEAERRLALLQPLKGTYISDYILAIGRKGKGRKVAREVARMQESRLNKDWRGLLAACHRLEGNEVLHDDLKRIMVSLGAMEDAVLL